MKHISSEDLIQTALDMFDNDDQRMDFLDDFIITINDAEITKQVEKIKQDIRLRNVETYQDNNWDNGMWV